MNEPIAAHFDLAWAIKREQGVRAGTIPPRTEDEHRQHREGPRAPAKLDSVKPQPKPGKYRNVPTVVDGVKFASKLEARRWSELQRLQKAGEISGLECQHRYKLTAWGRDIATYVSDFDYVDKSGGPVTEDCKSRATLTDAFRIKAKLFRAMFGRDINIVGVKE